MLSKLILISALGTGALGTGVVGSGVVGSGSANGITPSGFAYFKRSESLEGGGDKFLQAHIADHSPMSLKINLRSGGQVHVKF